MRTHDSHVTEDGLPRRHREALPPTPSSRDASRAERPRRPGRPRPHGKEGRRLPGDARARRRRLDCACRARRDGSKPPTPREAPRAPGRPRSERAEQAIIDATIEALGERGIDGVHCEDVAARAGVGKATLYRRWQGKEDLLIAAFAAMRRPLPEPRGESVRADLIALLTVVAADADDPRYAQQYALLHGAGSATRGSSPATRSGSSSRGATWCARCCAAASRPASSALTSTSRSRCSCLPAP